MEVAKMRSGGAGAMAGAWSCVAGIDRVIGSPTCCQVLLFASGKQQLRSRRSTGKVLSVTRAGGRVDESSGVFQGCSLALASLVSGLISRVPSSLALNYDDVVSNLQLPGSDIGIDSTFGIDFPDAVGFLTSNPLALVTGLFAFALPVVVIQILKKNTGYGTVSAKEAFSTLSSEPQSQLLDIRTGEDIRTDGSPDLKSLKKRVFQLGYSDDEVADYVAKILPKFKDAANISVYILDRFDGHSAKVAKLLATSGFKSAYAIKDGAEGPTGWKKSELPWLVPSKGFSFDIGKLKELFDKDNASLVPATLGVAAAAGVGLVVFSEAETALQLLGSAVLIQLFLKKFLFAKDRKKTIEELKTFLDTKVAPKELVDELKGIGQVLLPKYEQVNAATVNGAVLLETPAVEEAPAITQNVETPTLELEEKLATSSVSEAEKETSAATSTTATSLPRTPKPLSPYAQYDDLKPPSSPTPSRP